MTSDNVSHYGIFTKVCGCTPVTTPHPFKFALHVIVKSHDRVFCIKYKRSCTQHHPRNMGNPVQPPCASNKLYVWMTPSEMLGRRMRKTS